MEEVIEEELIVFEVIYYDSYSKISDNSFRVRIDFDVEEGDGFDVFFVFFFEFLLLYGYLDVIFKFDFSNINNSKYLEVVKVVILEGF